MATVTVGDLLTVPEIAEFTSRRPVLRLKREDNQIHLNGSWYELRLFAFLVPGSSLRFVDFVRERGLENKPLTPYSQLKHVKPLSFSIVDNSVLLNISLLPVIFTLPLAN